MTPTNPHPDTSTSLARTSCNSSSNSHERVSISCTSLACVERWKHLRAISGISHSYCLLLPLTLVGWLHLSALLLRTFSIRFFSGGANPTCAVCFQYFSFFFFPFNYFFSLFFLFSFLVANSLVRWCAGLGHFLYNRRICQSKTAFFD